MQRRKQIRGFAAKWWRKFRPRNAAHREPARSSGEEPVPFRGTQKGLRIASNRLCYSPMPAPGKEAEQHLTIDARGRVWFSGSACGRGKTIYVGQEYSRDCMLAGYNGTWRIGTGATVRYARQREKNIYNRSDYTNN